MVEFAAIEHFGKCESGGQKQPSSRKIAKTPFTTFVSDRYDAKKAENLFLERVGEDRLALGRELTFSQPPDKEFFHGR